MLVAAAAISIRLYGRLVVQPDLKFIGSLIRRAFPFFILLVLSMVFDRIGVIILSTIQGEFDTGIYSASDRLVTTMLQPVAIFGGIILPVMSRLSADDEDRLANLYETCIKLVVGLLLPLSTFLFLLAEEVVLIVYGDSFTEAVDVLKILSWLMLVGGISVVASTMMMAINHEHNLLRGKFLIVSGYIVACLMVIPLYSYIGLSIAKLLAFSGISLFCLYYLRDRMPLPRIWNSIRAPLLSCLVAGVIYTFTPDIDVWVRAIILLVCYFVMMCLLRAIRLQDLVYLKRVLIG
jgi:O-antigen/teichoic acid export membrane protein